MSRLRTEYIAAAMVLVCSAYSHAGEVYTRYTSDVSDFSGWTNITSDISESSGELSMGTDDKFAVTTSGTVAATADGNGRKVAISADVDISGGGESGAVRRVVLQFERGGLIIRGELTAWKDRDEQGENKIKIELHYKYGQADVESEPESWVQEETDESDPKGDLDGTLRLEIDNDTNKAKFTYDEMPAGKTAPEYESATLPGEALDATDEPTFTISLYGCGYLGADPKVSDVKVEYYKYETSAF